ncbi:HPP family protein [Tribonema minus]|uniref:HPP family protein n=1 Tax=Tribonema minus TaxID=303371 RepID=A0A836C780_9STRA|nr:HPP family protein [Tribonema minus]
MSATGLPHINSFRRSLLRVCVGSFGATAVLLYAAPMSPLTQPRNLLGGHILSAIVGVTVRILITEQLCGAHGADCRWLGCALAVSISILIMLFTDTLHPPGGATALIAAMGSPVIDDMGYMFVLVPAASGALLMLLVCLVINNLDPYRSYPQYWF